MLARSAKGNVHTVGLPRSGQLRKSGLLSNGAGALVRIVSFLLFSRGLLRGFLLQSLLLCRFLSRRMILFFCAFPALLNYQSSPFPPQRPTDGPVRVHLTLHLFNLVLG